MNNITVLIPICPMPSHPSTQVLDEVIASIRERLPDSEIILMFDGVNPTLMHLKTNYDKFTQHMLWRTNLELNNVIPLFFEQHMHQSLMLKKALEIVRTPLILWSEQDTPLHNEIPFEQIAPVVLNGYANSVRFSHEANILPEHKDLFLDEEPIEILGVPLLRTRQWSGRPHLASTNYYRDIVAKYWTEQPEFIEHRMYGVALGGEFDEHRLHLYAPSGTLVTSKHLDGRRLGAEDYDPNPS